MGFQWWNSSWDLVKKITIPSAQIGGAGSLSDLRILIDVTDADVQASAQADGDDIAFCDTDGCSQLDHELISYDSITGAILAWVRIPTISDASEDYEIWMYYKNAGCAAQENPDGVWKDAPTTAATAVYHFEGDVVDSSGNSNDGTNDGTTSGTGEVGDCRDFDGTNDSISVPAAGFATVQVDTTVSVGAWIKATTTGERQTIICKGNTGDEVLSLYIDENGKVTFEDYHAATYEYSAKGATDLRDSAWHRVWGVRNGSTFSVYVDGVDDTNTTTSGSGTTARTEDLYMGKRYNDDYFLDGSIDEAWILEGALNAAEIEADYNTANDPASFMTFGSESTWVEQALEMPMTVSEKISVDSELPMSVLEGTANRRTIVNVLEWLYANGEMRYNPAPLTTITADLEMPLIVLEEIQANLEPNQTILEWIEQGLEPPAPILQGIYKDSAINVQPSQDRADDLGMPMTILQEISVDPDLPITVLEYIAVDSEPVVSYTEALSASREMPLWLLKELYADRLMGFDFGEYTVTVQREMVLHILEGIYADNDAPVSIEEICNLYNEMPTNILQGLYNNNDMPISLSEHIIALFGAPLHTVEPVTSDNSVPVEPGAALNIDREMRLAILEYIVSSGQEVPVHITEGIHSDENIPTILREKIVSDEEAVTFVREYLYANREPRLSLSKEYPPTPVSADREASVFIMAGVREDGIMLATLSEFIVAAREMPIEWWDEVKYIVPYGRYQLRKWSYNYRLDVFEGRVNKRGGEKVETKS